MCEGAGVEVADDQCINMKRDLIDTSIYFIAWLSLSFVYALVSVFLFGISDPSWGANLSAQILTSILGSFGFVASVSFLFGHARFGYPLRLTVLISAALASLFVVVLAGYLTKSLYGALVISAGVGFGSGAVGKYFVKGRRLQ